MSIESEEDTPGLTSQAPNTGSLGTKGVDGTISMVCVDLDVLSINDMITEDVEFASLHLNSLIALRVPDEVIAIDNLDEKEWMQEED